MSAPFALLFEETVEIGPPPPDFDAIAAKFRPPVPTGRRDQILMIASRGDSHADAVSRELIRQGHPVRRLDTGEGPDGFQLRTELGGGFPSAIVTTATSRILVSEVKSVWMRRPVFNVFHAGALPDSKAALAVQGASEAFHGLMSVLGGAHWINPVSSLWKAENKARQLRMARERGFAIPRTLITSDPEQARAFHEAENGRIVVKAFRGQIGSPRTAFRMIFTSRVKTEHFAFFDRIRYSPCIFQQEVSKDAEIRVTVMGDQVFPVEIRSEGGGLDWRDDSIQPRYQAATLPPDIEEACRRLTRDFGLVTAGIDLIREPDGRHVFLELNAHHDWLWLAHITGLPMVSAFAGLLSGEQSE